MRDPVTGFTCLHHASLNGHSECVGLILESGACKLNAVDYKGSSALHLASWAGNLQVVRVLLNFGRSRKLETSRPDGGGTHVSETGPSEWQAQGFGGDLLQAGSSAARVGQFPLGMEEHKSGSPTRKEFELELGANECNSGGNDHDISHNSGNNNYLRDRSVQQSEPTTERELVGGASTNNAGHLSASNGQLPFEEIDIDLVNNDSQTALSLAAQFGHNEVVAELLAHGANCHIRNKQFESALDLACSNGRLETVRLLLDASPLLVAQLRRSHATITLDELHETQKGNNNGNNNFASNYGSLRTASGQSRRDRPMSSSLAASKSGNNSSAAVAAQQQSSQQQGKRQWSTLLRGSPHSTSAAAAKSVAGAPTSSPACASPLHQWFSLSLNQPPRGSFLAAESNSKEAEQIPLEQTRRASVAPVLPSQTSGQQGNSPSQLDNSTSNSNCHQDDTKHHDGRQQEPLATSSTGQLTADKQLHLLDHSPLHLAVRRNHLHLVACLLAKYGANLLQLTSLGSVMHELAISASRMVNTSKVGQKGDLEGAVAGQSRSTITSTNNAQNNNLPLQPNSESLRQNCLDMFQLFWSHIFAQVCSNQLHQAQSMWETFLELKNSQQMTVFLLLDQLNTINARQVKQLIYEFSETKLKAATNNRQWPMENPSQPKECTNFFHNSQQISSFVTMKRAPKSSASARQSSGQENSMPSQCDLETPAELRGGRRDSASFQANFSGTQTIDRRAMLAQRRTGDSLGGPQAFVAPQRSGRVLAELQERAPQSQASGPASMSATSEQQQQQQHERQIQKLLRDFRWQSMQAGQQAVDETYNRQVELERPHGQASSSSSSSSCSSRAHERKRRSCSRDLGSLLSEARERQAHLDQFPAAPPASSGQERPRQQHQLYEGQQWAEPVQHLVRSQTDCSQLMSRSYALAGELGAASCRRELDAQELMHFAALELDRRGSQLAAQGPTSTPSGPMQQQQQQLELLESSGALQQQLMQASQKQALQQLQQQQQPLRHAQQHFDSSTLDRRTINRHYHVYEHEFYPPRLLERAQVVQSSGEPQLRQQQHLMHTGSIASDLGALSCDSRQLLQSGRAGNRPPRQQAVAVVPPMRQAQAAGARPLSFRGPRSPKQQQPPPPQYQAHQEHRLAALQGSLRHDSRLSLNVEPSFGLAGESEPRGQQKQQVGAHERLSQGAPHWELEHRRGNLMHGSQSLESRLAESGDAFERTREALMRDIELMIGTELLSPRRATLASPLAPRPHSGNPSSGSSSSQGSSILTGVSLDMDLLGERLTVSGTRITLAPEERLHAAPSGATRPPRPPAPQRRRQQHLATVYDQPRWRPGGEHGQQQPEETGNGSGAMRQNQSQQRASNLASSEPPNERPPPPPVCTPLKAAAPRPAGLGHSGSSSCSSSSSASSTANELRAMLALRGAGQASREGNPDEGLGLLQTAQAARRQPHEGAEPRRAHWHGDQTHKQQQAGQPDERARQQAPQLSSASEPNDSGVCTSNSPTSMSRDSEGPPSSSANQLGAHSHQAEQQAHFRPAQDARLEWTLELDTRLGDSQGRASGSPETNAAEPIGAPAPPSPRTAQMCIEEALMPLDRVSVCRRILATHLSSFRPILVPPSVPIFDTVPPLFKPLLTSPNVPPFWFTNPQTLRVATTQTQSEQLGCHTFAAGKTRAPPPTEPSEHYACALLSSHGLPRKQNASTQLGPLLRPRAHSGNGTVLPPLHTVSPQEPDYENCSVFAEVRRPQTDTGPAGQGAQLSHMNQLLMLATACPTGYDSDDYAASSCADELPPEVHQAAQMLARTGRPRGRLDEEVSISSLSESGASDCELGDDDCVALRSNELELKGSKVAEPKQCKEILVKIVVDEQETKSRPSETDANGGTRVFYISPVVSDCSV